MIAHIHPDQILRISGPSYNHLRVLHLPQRLSTGIPQIRADTAQGLPDLELLTQLLSGFDLRHDDHTALNSMISALLLMYDILDCLLILLFLNSDTLFGLLFEKSPYAA